MTPIEVPVSAPSVAARAGTSAADAAADAAALHQRLRAARLRVSGAAGTGGCVLDELLRDGTSTAPEWDVLLRRYAGVAAVTINSAALPDWSAMSRERAHALQCVPLRLPGEAQARLGLADPWDDAAVRAAAAAFGALPELAAVDSAVLQRHLGARPDMAPAHSASGFEAQADAPGAGAHRQGVGAASPANRSADAALDLAMSSTDKSVVDFVDDAIRQACELGASDVHFECDRTGVTVKLRRDGVMSPLARQAGQQRAQEVVSRIKVLAQLDITERRIPQDGRFRWQAGARGVDMRVSIMPSIHGEDAVLRLLDKSRLNAVAGAVSLHSLGFAPAEASRIRDLARLPHGMLLVTGPTGSGKTTTLYAAMSEFNDGLDKIITIEDPVEYELSGVLQIPVNERKGLTFAKGLRSILRHDPDRILVGEIRDAETAEIAVQSALTGHQVYTTVHANSIFDVTGRFRHFGLDMFGFMSALNGVVVQRLLRRVCPHCVGRRAATAAEVAWLQAQAGSLAVSLTGPLAESLTESLTDSPIVALAEVPQACGCVRCQGGGYRGRGVIAEVHVVDDALRDLVTGNAPVSALRKHVSGSGVSTLAQQGAHWVAKGTTTLEELRRVVGWV